MDSLKHENKKELGLECADECICGEGGSCDIESCACGESYECDEHIHTHGEHTHIHSHQHTKTVVNRLAKAIGHLQSVKKMVESGRDCTDVLVQLSAVIAALNNTGKVILEDHIETCIVDAVQTGDQKALDDLKMAIDRFVK